eukprot:TRINITY_DN22750_c0_g1_i13.p1 TRINITY_DN22750_c0_g1~~TRINITY_DN22750_c0_g1_i13.p1  ORF type:complete len:142 (-),score=32.37 TRINITY_DN22750_c0_g1_i13:11-436(-)
MGEFAGKTAIVTGGSRGIGLTVATLLVERGARVVLVGRNDVALASAAEALGEGAALLAGDIAQANTATRAVAKAIDHGGGLDILANIAGIFPTARIEETSDALYADTIAANLTGTMIFCRAEIGRAVQQECRDRSRMPSSA